jgi:hypothetical protein
MSKTGLSTVDLEKGQAATAEASLRPVVEELRSEKDSADEAAARVLLVRALAAQNKLPEAQKEMSAAMALIMNASQRNVRYSAWTTSARLRASLGGASNVSQAIGILEKTAREASQAGMPGFELEARLAMGQIEQAQGNAARGRTELSAVEKDAAAKGFLLIAQKAAK